MKTNKIRIPQQERAVEKKNRIITAASAVFSQKGFHKTNSKDIAENAGVSIGTFYAYFRDKKDVFLEIVNKHIEHTMDNVFNSIATISQIPSDKKLLVRSIIEPLIKAHEIFPDLHEVINALKYTDIDVKRACIKSEIKSIQKLEEILKKWKSELRINDCKTAAVLIMRTTDEIIHLLTLSSQNYWKVNKQRLLEDLIDMIARYVFD